MLVHDVQEGLQIELELKPFVFVSAAKSFAVQHGMTIKMSDEPVPGWRDLRAKSMHRVAKGPPGNYRIDF